MGRRRRASLAREQVHLARVGATSKHPCRLLNRDPRSPGWWLLGALRHGLPAALLARDVITGLRMATEGVFEITRVVEGVNRLIHRAALSSKFVTMFLGVLEPDGVLAYCNAGHNPPLLLRGGTFEELDRGGTVLGPLGSARFQRAEVRLGPGDTLALFTDGLVERAGPGGEAYGTDRLRRLLLQGLSAAASVDAIFADCDAFGGGAPLEDDVTVIVVRKC